MFSPKATSDHEAAHSTVGHPFACLMVGRRSVEKSRKCVLRMPFHNSRKANEPLCLAGSARMAALP